MLGRPIVDSHARSASVDPGVMVSEQLSEYPSNHVVSVAPSRRVAEACRDAVLHSPDVGAISDDAVEILDPSEHEEIATGPAESPSLILRLVLGDESPFLADHAQALRSGQFLVSVGLADPDEVGEEEHAATKQAVGRALVGAGGASPVFFGRWQVEELGQQAPGDGPNR